MSIFLYIVAGIYFTALFYVTIYCMMQFHLLYHYKKHHIGLKAHPELKVKIEGELPFVTIQLPIFNEMYVVERLVDNIVKFDYPKDKFELHLLDDSTDETMDIAKRKVDEYVAKGFNIKHITRTNRTGFKAGALKEGMQYAKGEFIAIFDADFLPNPDFLKRTLPYFNNPNTGVVQTRWDHINQDYSLLTQLQAFQLNVHFTVEQQGRESGNYLLQFNGTAGVWRRRTIEDAGGWEADTLTEDLDLSYRAQLKGWNIVFLEDCTSPAELPAEMNGLKSQQFRWMKGGAETAKKMLPAIWNSDLKTSQKIHASTHLLASSVFLSVFIMGVFSVPLVFIINPLDFNLNILGVFMIGLVSIIMVYYVANVQGAWKDQSTGKMILKFLILFPIFLALSMGLSFHNSIAVLQGYWGKKSPFVRTPKFNIQGITDSIKTRKYFNGKISKVTIFEGFLAIYFLVALIAGFHIENNAFMLLHLLLTAGYGAIFFLSVKHLLSKS